MMHNCNNVDLNYLFQDNDSGPGALKRHDFLQFFCSFISICVDTRGETSGS